MRLVVLLVGVLVSAGGIVAWVRRGIFWGLVAAFVLVQLVLVKTYVLWGFAG